VRVVILGVSSCGVGDSFSLSLPITAANRERRMGSIAIVVLAAAVAYALLILWLETRQSRGESEGERKAFKGVEWMLLVTAHPDDESMFFLPTINAFPNRQDVYVLCLSKGDFDGLGKVREKELLDCCSGILALKPGNVLLRDDEKLRDGPNNHWPLTTVASSVSEAIKNIRDSRPKPGKGALVTFDVAGISGHVNHVAVSKGVQHLYSSGEHPEVEFYQLESVNVFRKFSSFLDILPSLVYDCDVLLVTTDLPLSYDCMAAHASQFVWYRKLFILFSRYSFINTLHRIPLATPP